MDQTAKASNSARQPLPRRQLTWIIGGAIAVGLLLFMLIWSRDRQQPFFKAGPDAQPASSEGQVQVFEPLPAPLPAGEIADASQLPAPPPSVPATIETPRAEPPRPVAPSAPVRPSTPAQSRPTTANRPPIPVSQPEPRYPRAALRAAIGGTVQVQVDVGPDGVPTSVSLVQGSGNRELDRAALDAVRRWRFQPAMANGQPSVGRVTVPIQFRVND